MTLLKQPCDQVSENNRATKQFNALMLIKFKHCQMNYFELPTSLLFKSSTTTTTTTHTHTHTHTQTTYTSHLHWWTCSSQQPGRSPRLLWATCWWVDQWYLSSLSWSRGPTNLL